MLMKVSGLNGLFCSLLDQSVSSFARADVLASFEFDSDTYHEQQQTSNNKQASSMEKLAKIFPATPKTMLDEILAQCDSDLNQAVIRAEIRGHVMDYAFSHTNREVSAPNRNLPKEYLDFHSAVESSLVSLSLHQQAHPCSGLDRAELEIIAGGNPRNLMRNFVPVAQSICCHIAGKQYVHLNRIRTESEAETIWFLDQKKMQEGISCLLIEASTKEIADRAEDLLCQHIAHMAPLAIFKHSRPAQNLPSGSATSAAAMIH
jgi:hypothetical protein